MNVGKLPARRKGGYRWIDVLTRQGESTHVKLLKIVEGILSRSCVFLGSRPEGL